MTRISLSEIYFEKDMSLRRSQRFGDACINPMIIKWHSREVKRVESEKSEDTVTGTVSAVELAGTRETEEMAGHLKDMF